MTTKTGDLVLDEWQREILDYKGNVLLCTGRQVGKTTIFAIKAGEYLIKHPKCQIIIVSLTEDQAKLIIVMILDYLEKKYKNQIAKGKDKPTQTRITLKNGASALARPVGTTGDAVRGFTGDVLIIDEASRMPELAFTASRPTLLTTAGQLWICSTPHGKQGYFWESFQNKNNRFKVFHINSEEVVTNRPISQTWTQTKKEEAIKFLQEEKRDMSELRYGQEYLGLFLDDLQQYFSDDLIDQCCVAKRPEPPRPLTQNYMGVDIARMGRDECAFEILHKLDTEVVQVENITKTKQLTTQTETNILQLTNKWNLAKIGIDAGSGSLGVGIYDRLLANVLTKRKVIPMNNRSISLDRDQKKQQRIFKEDMYENLLNMMEKGEIKLLNDDNLRLSLKSVQFEFVEFKGITKVKIFGNYTHIVEGLVRAAWLVKKEKINKLQISYIR